MLEASSQASPKDIRNASSSPRSASVSFTSARGEEVAGERTAARSRFESLRSDLARERLSGALVDDTNAAIKRLQGQ